MPFTISHAVLAPPLAKLSGNRLPIAALAIGTMTPDLYRLFTRADYDMSHQWQGLIFPNLMIGIGFCLVWYGLYRSVIFKFIGMHKPIHLNSAQRFFMFSLSILIALILGIATHLIWDGLTHSDFRAFAFQDFLNRSVSIFGHTYPMHRTLQIGSSIIALPIIFGMGLHYYFKFKQTRPVAPRIKHYAIGLVTIALFYASYSYLKFSQALGLGPKPWSNDLYWYIGKAINHFTGAFLIVFTLGCLVFLWLDRKHYFDR